MDPVTSNILISLGTNYFSSFTAPVIKEFFKTVFNLRPSLEIDLKNAKSEQDFEKVFQEAVGVIDAKTESGFIEIDSSFLQAVKGIRFDHQNGLITIADSRLQSAILQIGGNGYGQTTVTDSLLKAQGSEIKIGNGASIKINGNAQIRQS